jgi:hypothetical protein
MKIKSFRSFSIIAAGLSVLAVPANAVNWTGSAGDSDFNNPANWDGGSLPGAGDVAAFNNQSATLSSGTAIGTLNARRSVTINGGSTTGGTGPLTINGATAINSQDTGGGANLVLNGDFKFANSGISRVRVQSSSSVIFGPGASVSGVGSNYVRFEGGGDITLSGVTFDNFDRVSINNQRVVVSGVGNTVTSKVELTYGGELAFLSAGDRLIANEVSSASSGGWVFDLTTWNNTDGYIDAQTIDLSSVSLDISNLNVEKVNTFNPVILGQYGPGGLTGGFVNEGSLWLPNQRIDYNFNGSGLIAIVPEPSLALPILAGFLPLFGFRRRSRR